jgi:hypothetical protein
LMHARWHDPDENPMALPRTILRGAILQEAEKTRKG